MSEYTPITGELRDWFEHAYNYGTGEDMFKKVPAPWFGWKSTIEQMLDAIDSIHANLERENESLKAELDRVLGEQDNGATIPLPLDMDGEPVHIDDVMEWPTTGETFEVVGIGDGVLFYVEDGHELADWTGASTKRHHAPDTWERIIEDAIDSVDGGPTIAALVARCKALCARTMEDA